MTEHERQTGPVGSILRSSTRVVLVLSFACGLAFFAVGLVCHVLAAFGVAASTSVRLLPLGAPSHIVIGSGGNIYYYSNHYCQLQVYDEHGQFQIGWFVPPCNVILPNVEPEGVRVVTSDDWNILYDTQGRIIQKHRAGGSYEDNEGRLRLRARGPDGYTYYFAGTVLRTSLVKGTEDGEGKTVLTEPFHLWAIRSPFPALVYVGVPVGWWALREWHRRKRTHGNAGAV